MIYVVGWVLLCVFWLIDMCWGSVGLILILVGKGVCFDMGGLNLKSGVFMGLMKKDMGGVVIVLGLVYMIMVLNLFLWLCVLILVVENFVSGDVFWSGDILNLCKGLMVEINNIDVEGCLVFVDVLVLVFEENFD